MKNEKSKIKMSSVYQYLGEIRLFAGTYAPADWAFCNGQLLPINSDNQPLYSLIGNIYGGDGKTNFALPDLRGRVPVGAGQLSGGDNYKPGMQGGVETVTLNESQFPKHTHTFTVSRSYADRSNPQNAYLAAPLINTPPQVAVMYLQNKAPGDKVMLSMAADLLFPVGLGGSHENRMSYTTLNYIIALKGAYPNRS